MRKSFATDDHAEVIAASGGQAFQFFDESDRFTKSASDVVSRSDIQAHMPPSSHFGVHLITMGAEETFGANRNGDSASVGALDKYHGTFEKFGCVYREHANRNPVTQGVGQVKMAKFNPKMSRGELIVWVEKDKAPDMHKQAKAGEELSWSMSMRLPYDECSCCHKKSARIDQYCDHLRDNMLQWVPGFEKFAYARNEQDLKFFDISEVKRRADRIASYLGYSFSPEDMAKAASQSKDMVINGGDWADHIFGADQVTEFLPWENLTLEKMATAAEFVRHADDATLATLAAMAPRNLSHEQIETLAEQDFRNVGGELAKKAMILPFESFASLVTGRRIEDLRKEADFCGVTESNLPNLIEDLFRNGGSCCGGEAADAVTPDEFGCSFSPGKDRIDSLMSEVGEELGMNPEQSQGRVMKVTVIKSASLKGSDASKDIEDPFYEALTQSYGHYVVKAAHQIKDLPHINPTSFYRILAASLLT